MCVPDEKTPWVVKGVPEKTRRSVKVYAAQQGITMAEALEQLVKTGLESRTELDKYQERETAPLVAVTHKSNAWPIAPAELEALLLEHPAVRDAAVIGWPDAETGEAPLAFVVLQAGETPT